MSVKEILEQRANKVAQARELQKRAVDEQRNLTAEEQGQFDTIMSEVDALKEKADGEHRSAENAKRLADLDRELSEVRSRVTEPDKIEGTETRQKKADEEYRKAFTSFLKVGINDMSYEEKRALSAGLATEGGYMVPSEQMGPFVKFMDNVSWMRRLATVIPVPNATSLGAVSLDNDPADPAWTAELLTGDEDSTMSFGKRSLEPHPLAKRLKISRLLLAKAPSAESLAYERLAYKFSVTEENVFLNGTGAQQPLGVFTASNDGISTARDVSTDNTSSSMTFDGIINAFYTLKPQYRARASWIFHRDGIKQLRKLKFSISSDAVAYIWEPSVKAGEQDTILGRPVYESEYAPNTFTTGLYTGIVGDFSNYWIADGMNMEVQRLTELYAATNQVGLIARRETDGMPVLAEAFVRVKLG